MSVSLNAMGVKGKREPGTFLDVENVAGVWGARRSGGDAENAPSLRCTSSLELGPRGAGMQVCVARVGARLYLKF